MSNGSQYASARSRPGSRKFADRLGGSASKLPLVLYPLMWEDTSWLYDDFLLDTINLDAWVLSADSGTAIATLAASSTALANGAITGTTGTDDENFISIHGPLMFLGDKNCGMEIRWKQDVVTNDLVELGFSDALTDETLPAVNDIDTPTDTNGFVNGALLVKDYSQTLKTFAFLTDGNTSNFNATKTNLGTQDLTAATYMTGRLAIVGDASFGALYDANGGFLVSASHGGATASSVEGGTLVWPRFTLGCKEASNAIAVDIDYIAAWEDRDTRA